MQPLTPRPRPLPPPLSPAYAPCAMTRLVPPALSCPAATSCAATVQVGGFKCVSCDMPNGHRHQSLDHRSCKPVVHNGTCCTHCSMQSLVQYHALVLISSTVTATANDGGLLTSTASALAWAYCSQATRHDTVGLHKHSRRCMPHPEPSLTRQCATLTQCCPPLFRGPGVQGAPLTPLAPAPSQLPHLPRTPPHRRHRLRG